MSASPNLLVYVRQGLRALKGPDAKKVIDGRLAGCSINLEECRKLAEPNSPVWDYLLVSRHNEPRSAGMEVHRATAGEVDRIIAKKAWAEALLKRECPLLRPTWHWISTDGVSFTQDTPKAHLLKKAGIRFPQRVLQLKPVFA